MNKQLGLNGGMMTITCGNCGAVEDIDKWTVTALGVELPRGQYQCPRCRYAFQRRATGWQTIEDGRGAVLYVEKEIKLVQVEALL